jgi:arginase
MDGIKNSNSFKVAIVLQPYTGHRRGPELSPGPEVIYKELVKLLGEMRIEHGMKEEVKLTSEEEKDYGVWHRLGLADSHLAKIIARLKREGEFPLGLLANCNSLMGMLAGLQHSGSTRRPLNVGLVWLDAHADFNTPETTLSGMLGGMPVACAAGRCLFRLRFKAGLDPAIATNNIIMMAVRDVDPLEQELIDDSNITMISTEDLIKRSRKLKKIIAHLSQRVDVIYIHIDLDVLDPTEIPGANLPAPNGPTADQLAESLKLMMGFEKVGALGIASFPIEEEGRKASLKSTIKVIQGALAGLKSR